VALINNSTIKNYTERKIVGAWFRHLLPFTTSGQEMERVYSYYTGARRNYGGWKVWLHFLSSCMQLTASFIRIFIRCCRHFCQ